MKFVSSTYVEMSRILFELSGLLPLLCHWALRVGEFSPNGMSAFGPADIPVCAAHVRSWG